MVPVLQALKDNTIQVLTPLIRPRVPLPIRRPILPTRVIPLVCLNRPVVPLVLPRLEIGITTLDKVLVTEPLLLARKRQLILTTPKLVLARFVLP